MGASNHTLITKMETLEVSPIAEWWMLQLGLRYHDYNMQVTTDYLIT